MKSRSIPVITIVASIAALGGMTIVAQDKYTVQVPGGLALSECRGYEDWPAVAARGPLCREGAGHPLRHWLHGEG
jgi:hypothetical protein